jgi:hypothetical protein
MTLQVVGAGLGRTGTSSLKLALEALLGGPCYHMLELMERDADTPTWEAAVEGRPVDWGELLRDYRATVDWPAAAFWPELLAANPRAKVLLSTRESARAWWESMERTIIVALGTPAPPDDPALAFRRRVTRATLSTRLTPDWSDEQAACAAYERHNAAVRAQVPADQLIEWQPGDGWDPLCAALAVPVPAEPFPHENTTAVFRARVLGDAQG